MTIDPSHETFSSLGGVAGLPPVPSGAELDEELLIVQHEWMLGEWLGLSRFPKGRNNESFRLRTSRGDFVLRRSRVTKTTEAMRFEFAMVGHVRAGGVPAPPPLPTRSGDAWADSGARLWSVFDFVDGR